MALPTSIELLLRQSQRGVGQINARSGAKQSALSPYAGRAQANYAPAISNTQALGGALSGSLARQGGELAGSLTAALEGIQAPGQAIETQAGGVAQTGAGAAGAVGGLSSADLGRLRGFSSAEQVYAAALPRLAKLAGEQERRGFLAQAQEQLADLALREADQAREAERQNREWAYKVRQDQLDRRRQGMLDRRAFGETRYDRRQDALDRKRQAKLDRLAAQAAAQEYGLDVADLQLDVRSQTERERAARAREQQARAREQRQRAKDARDAAADAKGGGNADAFYDTREDAFKRAREYAKGSEDEYGDPVKIPRAQARKRLMAEFGTALIGRGYKPKAVRQMIERALSAAGY